MNSIEPVFIVGAPRSGTTLLSAMISNHSRIACGPETQFFHKTNPKRMNAAVKDPNWPNKAVSLLASIRLSGQYITDLFDVSESEIRDFLKDREPGVQSMLEAICGQHAQKRGKKRWAEKTPNHLLHLDQIRREFPYSPIIRIIRDPRDSAISIGKLPWGNPSSIANGYLWDTWYRESKDFFRFDPNTLTIRYEDLVNDPEKELKKICELIGEVFEPEMLNTSQSGNEVTSPKEPWKAQVNEPLDPSRLYAWKRTINTEYARTLAYTCLDGIEEFGYEVPEKPIRSIRIYIPFPETVQQNEDFFIRMANKGLRLYREDRVYDTQEILMLKGRRKKLFKHLEARAAAWWIRRVRTHRRNKTWQPYELEI